MSDAEAADLSVPLIAGPLMVVLVLAIALTVLHVLALNGRRLLPERAASVVGWFVFGLVVGLITRRLPQDALTWIVAGTVAAWILWWARREGRLGDAGLALIGGALPWLLTGEVFIVVGALLIAGIGALFVVAAPRAPRARTPTPVQRAMLLPGAIDHAQAMGPLPAPLVLAFIAGLAASLAVLLLARDLDPLLHQLLTGLAFIAAGLGTWWIATPRRVTDAQAVIRWLVDAERQMWAVRVGQPLPRTPGALRHVLDWLPDADAVRPLRIEVLATLGRSDEARLELTRLPLETAEDRAVEAELADYVGIYAGTSDEAALHRWAGELPSIADPAARLRLRVSLAVARARHAAERRDPAAIDHLIAVRSELPTVSSRLRDPGTIGVIITTVLLGLGGFVVLPLIAALGTEVR